MDLQSEAEVERVLRLDKDYMGEEHFDICLHKGCEGIRGDKTLLQTLRFYHFYFLF